MTPKEFLKKHLSCFFGLCTTSSHHPLPIWCQPVQPLLPLPVILAGNDLTCREWTQHQTTNPLTSGQRSMKSWRSQGKCVLETCIKQVSDQLSVPDSLSDSCICVFATVSLQSVCNSVVFFHFFVCVTLHLCVCICVCVTHMQVETFVINGLCQVWANYGPRAGCGPFGLLIWLAKLVQIMLCLNYYYTSAFSLECPHFPIDCVELWHVTFNQFTFPQNCRE